MWFFLSKGALNVRILRVPGSHSAALSLCSSGQRQKRHSDTRTNSGDLQVELQQRVLPLHQAGKLALKLVTVPGKAPSIPKGCDHVLYHT